MGNENYTRLSNNAYDSIIKPNMDLIGAWVRDGHTIKWIANKLGITDRCLLKWKKQIPELHSLWDLSKEKTDIVDVVGAYLKSAKGYYVTEWTREYKFDEDGNRRLVHEYEKVRFVQPDVKAQENWIKHRLAKYEGWSDFKANTAKMWFDDSSAGAEHLGVVMIPEREDVIEVEDEEQVVEVVDT